MGRQRKLTAIVTFLLPALLVGCYNKPTPSVTAPMDVPKPGGQISIRGCLPERPIVVSDTVGSCGAIVAHAITARLMRENPRSGKQENDIAEAITTPDNLNFTIKIKRGFKFSDGTEVKARNFVDAWNYAAYGPNQQASSPYFAMIEGYHDVQCGEAACVTKPKVTQMSGLGIVDEYTFRVKTTAPIANLAMRLGQIHYAPQPDVFLDNPNDKNFPKRVVAAGPFMMESISLTDAVLIKNPHYSGTPKPFVDRITVRFYGDAKGAYTDLLANNVDFTDVIPTDQLINDQWRAQLGNRTLTRETGSIQVLTFSPSDEQLKTNLELRKALSMAIDRPSIVAQVFGDSRTPASGWVSPVVDGFEEGACGEWCIFNPDKAKALYDKAGGYKGTFRITVNNDVDHKIWADAVCNGLHKHLGVDCQASTTPDLKSLRQEIKSGDLKGAYRTRWQMGYASMESFLGPVYGKNAVGNDSRYDNPAFDEALAAAAATTDPAEAIRLYRQAEKMLALQLPSAPLWYERTPIAWSTRVKDVTLSQFGVVDLVNMSVK